MTHVTSSATQSGRIAALLGLKNAAKMDDVALADKIAEGLEAQAAIAMEAALGPTINVVGHIIPEATFKRAYKARKPLSREMSDRLYEVGRVWDLVCRSYDGDENAAAAFLSRSHPFLGGRAPLELACRSSAGADAVVNLMHRAEAGFSV
ncbi:MULTISPECIES: antitoxin Xre/MbcA/ParS toxin-binding domain-containing protein [unclassified Aliiroseovarius]|uniref:antitoxin Xre-like helix-turn-helix domain-containing protein n=1 Tax=unclassified Aliiroseovarius TaxID=2623558 RepID=UPI001FF31EC2|nr:MULTISPECIES: antitoxin Xre/MbcA/ParS toxin-binding domain-containing protein [unclassified Aliiroseovarius]MCK0137908.1 DUF2384 domain-containing protein [Aliiroseovarius sp. F47248L]MCK8463115.1 DUF2384 domain-containing protein [Aliiroseovarius sp. S1339]